MIWGNGLATLTNQNILYDSIYVPFETFEAFTFSRMRQ